MGLVGINRYHDSDQRDDADRLELRARRTELKLSQESLADAIGVNRRVIGELERGKGSVRLETAQALGLDFDLRARGA